MCVIVDANQLSIFVQALPVGGAQSIYRPLVNALLARKTKLDLGGTKLLTEYRRVAEMFRFVATLDRAGLVRKHDDSRVNAREQALLKAGRLRSDDPHVIALAEVARSMILCSEDKLLIQDFKDAQLLKPKRHVYSRKAHIALIKHC